MCIFCWRRLTMPSSEHNRKHKSAMNTRPHYEHSNVKRAIGCHEIWIWLNLSNRNMVVLIRIVPFALFHFQQNYFNSWCHWMKVFFALIPKTKRCDDQIILNDKRQHTFYAANYFWLLLWFFNIKPSYEIWNRYILHYNNIINIGGVFVMERGECQVSGLKCPISFWNKFVTLNV